MQTCYVLKLEIVVASDIWLRFTCRSTSGLFPFTTSILSLLRSGIQELDVVLWQFSTCRCLVDCREDYKYIEEAVECLIKAGLVNLNQYDHALATSMENGHNYIAVTLAMKLVQKLIIDDKRSNLVTESDLSNTIENLAKISTRNRQAPDGLVHAPIICHI